MKTADKKKVTFKSDDGESPWTVSVDGKIVIDDLREGDMDISANALNPLWKALGVEVEFIE